MLEQDNQTAEVVWDGERRATAAEFAEALAEIDARKLHHVNENESRSEVSIDHVLAELAVDTDAEALWLEIESRRTRAAHTISDLVLRKNRARKRLISASAAVLCIALVSQPFARVRALSREAENSAELLKAIHADNLPAVEALLAHGNNPNSYTAASPQIDRWKPLLNPLAGHVPALTIAVNHLNVPVAEALLNAHADANIRDEMGSTPLHWLAGRTQFGDSERAMLKLLLKHGANANIRDGWGRSARDFAATQKHEAFVQALDELSVGGVQR